MDNVHRYSIRTWPLWFSGLTMAFLAIPFAISAIYSLSFLDGLDKIDLMLVTGLIGFGGLAAYPLGLATGKPTGLRMDADGISGYLAPTLKWDDIKRIQPYRIHRGTCIGIELHDPEAYRARVSNWERVSSHMMKRPFHAGINTSSLEEDAFQIAERMQAYLDAP